MSVPGEEEEDGEDQEDDDVFSTTTDTELEELLFAHGFIANPPAPLPDDIARAARLVDSMLANPERANYYIAQQQQQQQQQQRIGAAATLPPMPAASRTASLPDPMSIGSMGNSSSGGGGAGSGLAVGGGGGGVGPFAVDAKPVSSTVMPSYLGVSSAAALQTTATVQRFSSAPQCLPGVQQQGGWGGNVGGAGVGASYGQMGGPMFLRAHGMCAYISTIVVWSMGLVLGLCGSVLCSMIANSLLCAGSRATGIWGRPCFCVLVVCVSTLLRCMEVAWYAVVPLAPEDTPRAIAQPLPPPRLYTENGSPASPSSSVYTYKTTTPPPSTRRHARRKQRARTSGDL